MLPSFKFISKRGEKYAKFLERVKTKKKSFYELNYKQSIIDWQISYFRTRSIKGVYEVYKVFKIQRFRRFWR